MYDQAVKTQTATDQKETALPRIHKSFIGLNDEQGGLLNQIESKLHDILSKRTPEKEMSPIPQELSSNDFTTAIDQQLDRVRASNRRLEKVLGHLSNII